MTCAKWWGQGWTGTPCGENHTYQCDQISVWHLYETYSVICQHIKTSCGHIMLQVPALTSHEAVLCEVHHQRPHMNVVTDAPIAINNMIRKTGIHHFTLLAYAPESTCLPYQTYIFYWTTTVVYT